MLTSDPLPRVRFNEYRSPYPLFLRLQLQRQSLYPPTDASRMPKSTASTLALPSRATLASSAAWSTLVVDTLFHRDGTNSEARSAKS